MALIVESLNRIWPIGLLLLTVILVPILVEAKDVTVQVIKETNLDEEIANACQKHCHGNRRKGTLKRVTVDRIGQFSFNVRADVSLRNRHHQSAPIGGGVQLYSYTIDVEAYGTLDSRTCDLTIQRIETANDRIGVAQLAKGQVGKVHKIDHCQKFLKGL